MESARIDQKIMPYLGNTSMKATSNSLALVSSVLNFDIVELWSDEDKSMEKIHCTYVHATDEVKMKFPDLISGHYPLHKKQHTLSPKLCALAIAAENRCYWKNKDSNPAFTTDSKSTYSIILARQTEMAYLLDYTETDGNHVFIVGFSINKIEFNLKKLRFLKAVAVTIYVAAYDLDEEHSNGSDSPENYELDVKKFIPSKPLTSTPYSSSAFLSSLAISKSSNSIAQDSETARLREPFSFQSQGANDYVVGTPRDLYPSDEIQKQTSSKEDTRIGLPMVPENAIGVSDHVDNDVIQKEIQETTNETTSPTESSSSKVTTIKALVPPLQFPIKTEVISFEKCEQFYPTLPPTWEPADVFSFPVIEIAPKCYAPDNLTWNDFSDVKHLADGSNANVFLGNLKNERVIIKMIKAEVQYNEVAAHEFDLEHGILCRISHPNIIKVLGAGTEPRRFVVLEWLGGGTLSNILNEHQPKPGITSRLFKKPSFTYANLLSRARDMAEAFDYLHTRCHPGACIIHRDLKPDNVGFTSDGTLKLFDFGLVTCVKARQSSDEAYKMTGYTGSLRYMAPEVALRKSYTEKVDVYSFGIMLWQMATDKVPFKGFNKDEFMVHVVRDGYRPKVDPNWPPHFSDLLIRCWDPNPKERPSFNFITNELDKLMGKNIPQKVPADSRRVKSMGTSSVSSWF